MKNVAGNWNTNNSKWNLWIQCIKKRSLGFEISWILHQIRSRYIQHHHWVWPPSSVSRQLTNKQVFNSKKIRALLLWIFSVKPIVNQSCQNVLLYCPFNSLWQIHLEAKNWLNQGCLGQPFVGVYISTWL